MSKARLEDLKHVGQDVEYENVLVEVLPQEGHDVTQHRFDGRPIGFQLVLHLNRTKESSGFQQFRKGSSVCYLHLLLRVLHLNGTMRNEEKVEDERWIGCIAPERIVLLRVHLRVHNVVEEQPAVRVVDLQSNAGETIDDGSVFLTEVIFGS